MTAKTKTKLLVTGVFAFFGWLCSIAATDESAQTATAKKPEKVYTFSDAVMAVATSDMFSSDKQDAIEIIRSGWPSDLCGEASEYYRGIIGIAESDMFSSDKLDAIKRLNAYRNE